ncbi:ATP-dependent endonuclease [Stappia sp. TSB10P1A]|uniref:ATP-dependent nuclease n=1 Tax=Stappia sp. TSB10P1A TaxID=2003585 RepID=UPI001643CAD4|nr:AAA family ATPase [Stappia sp. TSB10P1A]
MRLVSFSVENYRSITNAKKIPLSDYSLLVGANNEGKSNILHALALGMNALIEWHRQVRRTSDGRVVRLPSSLIRSHRIGYDWDTDFPVRKQIKPNAGIGSSVTLEFALNEAETAEFKDEIKSNLNGTLPILIYFTKGDFEVTVKKPGRGQAMLTRKSTRIADFVSKRIRFEYIPAIRTAESAAKVISQLVDRELHRLEGDPEYAEAISKIEELQQPVFDELAEAIKSTVARFLPSVTSVELKSRREARYKSLRRDFEIIVDDGHLTRLDRKGDGVQSLAALALMRHASEQVDADVSTVIAIEEPESHLHPRAIHELRAVISNLALSNQVVLTSHSPLFVNPNNLSNTIIVKGSKAAPATQVSAVREALGVRFSDNLHNARLVVLVEGGDDVTALKAITSYMSPSIARALDDGSIFFDHLGGASGLRQKASFYKSGACLIQCFLDDDADGRKAMKRAIEDKVIELKDINLSIVPHLDEAEIEDIYDKAIYAADFIKKFGVDPAKKIKIKSKVKWSQRMNRIFLEAGKPWNDDVKFELKNWLAKFASANPGVILKNELSGPIRNFVSSIEAKLPDE